MKDVDWFSWFVTREDAQGVERARDHVTPEVLPDLVWLYGRHLKTWLQRALLVQLLQDHWEPTLFEPVMLDMLRAPTDWHDPGTADHVQLSQAVALGFLDERYDRFTEFLNDRQALRDAVAQMRRVRGLTADGVVDEPPPPEPYPADPTTRLEQACVRGDTDTAVSTLDTGLDVDTPLSIGTPMLHALIKGHPDLALRLLDRGASVSARWEYTGSTAMTLAGELGSVPLIDALLLRGVSPDETDDDGLTALYHAADCGRPAAVRRLLQAGADPRAATRSALVAAAARGSIETVDMLLHAGCGLEDLASWGQTALSCAAMLNQAPMLDFLIAAGADVDARDRDGRTPLMHAAARGLPGIVERLLRADADPHAVVPDGRDAGKTARDLVGRRRRNEVTTLLTIPAPPTPKPEPAPSVSARAVASLGWEFAREPDRVSHDDWPCAAQCPGRATPLVAIRRRGVPHRTPGHDTAYCYTFLAACTTCGTGRLESLTHDCWSDPEDEPWDLGWVRTVAPADVEFLRANLDDCPQWLNDRCDCRQHAAMVDSSERLGPSTAVATVAVVDGVVRFQPA